MEHQHGRDGRDHEPQTGAFFEGFRQRWCVDFPALVRQIPGVRRYVQNVAHDAARKQWPYDGVAEQCFDDVASIRAAFEAPAGIAAAKEELTFALPPR